MKFRLKKIARLLGAILIIISPVKMYAQNNTQWFLWNSSAKLPVKEGLSNTITGVSDGVLLVAGGNNFDKPIQQGGVKKVYDQIYVATDTKKINWKNVGHLPFPLANAAVVTFNNGLLVIGGTDGKNTSAKVFLLKWNTTKQKIEIDSSFANLPIPLSSLAAAKIGNTIYIAGGQDINNQPKHVFYELKVTENGSAINTQWEELTAWPGGAKFGAVMVAQSNGEYDCIYLMGGKGMDGYSNDVF